MRFVFEDSTKMAFAAAELLAIRERFGWRVNLPHLTEQIVEIFPGDLKEVYKKCLLEMVDRDLMEKAFGGESLDELKDGVLNRVQTTNFAA